MGRMGPVVFGAVLLAVACTDQPEPLAPKASLNIAAGGSKNYVVVFNQPSGLPQNVDRLVDNAGGAVTARLEEIGAIGVSSSDPEFVGKMTAQSQVKEVGEDIEVQMIPPTGSVEDFALNAHEDGSGGPAEPAGPDPQPGTEPLYHQQWDKMRMNASTTGSYAVQRGRNEVVVGILDTGIEITHPDLVPNLDFARSRSFFPVNSPNGDPNPARWDDRNGHGSWCASAVGSPINGVGISGVAPNVTLVALKVLGDNGSGSFVSLSQAIVYAGVNKFDVISMSLSGILRHSNGGQATITMLQRAVEFARSNGVTPLAALGNSNYDVSDGDFFRDFIVAPAEIPGVIGVSATGYYNRKSYYSSYGVGKTDVTAPGGDLVFQPPPPPYRGRGGVLGAWAPENIGAISPVMREEQCNPSFGGCHYYAYIQGTSMSTPNAAGVAALIVSQYGDFTPDGSRKGHISPTRVEAYLQQTANNQPCSDPNFFNPTITVPSGTFSFPATCKGEAGGYTNFFGKGIVDALKAVTYKSGS